MTLRRLIICCDGTWNTPDRTDGGIGVPTNVVRMARAIPPVAPDGTPQIVYYDQGVGTDNMINKYTGGAFGIGLSRNVRDAYLFLIHNYIEGDELYFFGFSRGAYTVRSTAGMIRKIGLLDKVEADRAMEAWRIYREHAGGPDSQRAIAFREAFSRYPVRIRFLGVWDTVGALGIPGAHMDVGGGHRDHRLADAALIWIADGARAAGLALNDAYMEQIAD
ncbi:MAG TPA: DUF2235 domain-containing protein, partial [Dehalococcoidia bacterium]|nr:DUF2235 domain-containing protein [Dehalococcoidia bacterium]